MLQRKLYRFQCEQRPIWVFLRDQQRWIEQALVVELEGDLVTLRYDAEDDDEMHSWEECVRLDSHNHQFLSLLEGPEPAGRKLNFILQEMNREANTMGSKAADVQIVNEVIAIKEEIEKIREQVQNVE